MPSLTGVADRALLDQVHQLTVSALMKPRSKSVWISAGGFHRVSPA